MQGDFEAFYLRHFKTIYRVCYAFMKNAQDAEDCTEDTFVKAMTSDVSFENERHERSWLTTTAMNICKDKLKRWWRQKVSPIDEDTEQTAAQPDEKSEVANAVMALPVKYKEVVWLHYYEGYQTAQIAQLLGMKESTVRSNLARGREKLKVVLKEAYDFEEPV